MDFNDDPRISSTTIVSGPMAGERLVAIDEVRLGRETVHIPRPLPGVPELAAVAEAETKANQLLPRIVQGLVDEGPAKWQKDATLVIEMRAAAESAVVTAMVGVEAFGNHHILRVAASNGGVINVGGRTMAPEEVFNLHFDERYRSALPAILGRPKPTQEKWWPALLRTNALAALTRHAIHEPVERDGLSGKRSLAERLYRGEYQGVSEMMLGVFDYFSPGWLSQERLAWLAEQQPAAASLLNKL